MRPDAYSRHYDPTRPPRRYGRLALALVALVVVCGAGWLGWRTLGSGGADGAAAAGPPHPSGDGAGAGRGSASAHGAHPSGTPSARPSASPGKPLSGRTVVVDPGHNPGNGRHPKEINAPVPMGDGAKPCDTTGTETDGGYTEARFTLDVGHRVEKLLKARGAHVVLTHDGTRAWGPCVDERARIGNEHHADAAISIHADGNTATGAHGFHVILPGRVHSKEADTRTIVGPSRKLGKDIRAAFGKSTGSPRSTYLGGGKGLVTRTDLGGLNLSRVPKVFLECGNMRNAAEAKKFTDPAWRQRAAQGIADGLTSYLRAARHQG